MDSKMIAGIVILALGGFLILVAVVLILVILHRRRKSKHLRPYSPDEFKVVYKMPMSNGNGVTKVAASDAFDGRSVHTIARSEPGYTYVAPPAANGRPPPLVLPAGSVIAQSPPPTIVASSPPPPQYLTQPVVVQAAPSVGMSTLPRAVPVESVPSYATLPRNRYVYPAGGASRVLVPISKKKAKRMQKRAAKPVYIPAYNNGMATGARSVMSVPAYATSVRSARSAASGPTQRNKYYMYGSTPNIAATHYTQPVLMYDGNKRYINEISAGRNEHVQNWLHRDHPTSLPDHERPTSRASSAPTDLDLRGTEHHPPLTLRWSPSMRRRMDDRDRRERESQSLSLQMSGGTPESPRRVAPRLHSYGEVAEAF